MGDLRMVKKILCAIVTLALAAGMAVKINHDYRWARMRVVNGLMTALEFKGLLTLEQPGGRLEDHEIRRFKSYFQQVTRLLPNQAEAYAMTGFCLFHLGQKDAALKSYQKAISIRPEFLWFYYDAGIICLSQRNYSEAAGYFQKALLTQPQINLAIVTQSKVFVDIIRQAVQPVEIPERLKEGYELSAYFARLSGILAQVKGSQDPDLEHDQKLRLRIF